MPSNLKKAIAAVKDHTSIGLAKVSTSNSSDLDVAVLKATSHDEVPIENRYVYEVLQFVSSNKAYAAACARAIGKRIGRTRNWVVALKSLILVLRIFQDGDPYFPREVLHAMKRGAKILNLSSFRDDSNSSSPWDFTAFVRTFALYLDERLECFITGKLQRRYTHRAMPTSIYYNRSHGRTINRAMELVRDMKPAMLLNKISCWQRLIDRAIATRPTGAAKSNILVQVSLYAIVQESFDLYRDISDGLALVLDSFFHLQYQNCVAALQTCVKACKQFKELKAFYSLCKSIGVGRTSEYPSVQTISEHLIESLQEYLNDRSLHATNAKPTNRLLLPAPPSSLASSSRREISFGGRSEFSATTNGYSTKELSRATSLEELINAAETGRAPAISIDLETYSSTRGDEGFSISDTGSARSLPVSTSMADFISLDGWSDKEEREQPHKQSTKAILDSSASKNWEAVLAETISSSAPTHPLLDNNTNSFNAFTEHTLSIVDRNLVSTGNKNNSANNWELALFEPPPQPEVQQPVPNIPAPPRNHYNPFVDDTVELQVAPNPAFVATLPITSNPAPFMSMPTFQATPTFSAQNPDRNSFPAQNENENDPFGSVRKFSGRQKLNSAANRQSFLLEQQLWLHNQSKIIAKHLV